MTVTATNTFNEFTTNGVTTEFAFDFAITKTSQVYAFTVDGDEQTEYTDFTVIKSDDSEGGTLTTNSTLDDVNLLIYRQVDFTQEVDYNSGGSFPAESHEQAIDKLTLQNQDQQSDLDRSLKSPMGSTETHEIGELEEGKVVAVVDGKVSTIDVTEQDILDAKEQADAAEQSAAAAEQSAAEAEEYARQSVSDLKAAAISAGTSVDNIIYSTDAVSALPDNIYDADSQVTYSVPSDAQGKFIDSVVGTLLTTTDTSEYNLVVATTSVQVNIENYGASTDSSEAVNTAAIQRAIDTGAKQIYRPNGNFSVTSLDYDHTVSFVGPGRIIPSNAFQTDIYGGIIRAGTKIGNTFPLDKHGGLLVGGEDVSGHGVLFKSQYNASVDIIASRESNPLEVQLYPNACTGRVTADGSGRVVFASGFTGDMSNMKVDDVLWIDDTEYQIGAIVDDNTVDLLDLPGLGAAHIDSGEHGSYYLYITIDTNVTISGTTVTRNEGDQFQAWGSDHNVIIEGVRYDVTVTDVNTLEILGYSGGDSTNTDLVFKFLSDERFCEIFRLQRMLGQGVEETLSISARPDMYKVRVGATGNSAGRQSPLVFETKAPEDNADSVDGVNILCLDDSGNIGIHTTLPQAALHVKRDYNSTQGADDVTKLSMRFEAVWNSNYGGRRSIDIINKNDYSAGNIQGRSGAALADAADITIQGDGGKVTIGKSNGASTDVTLVTYSSPRHDNHPEFETNSLAIAGGLGTGQTYHTSQGVMMIVI